LAGSARWQFRYQRRNASGAERHPVTSLGDKPLFEDLFVGGDAHIAPVVLQRKST
jgi:hypothetical protein